MTLRAHIVVARGSLNLDVWLNAEEGEVIALLGPNGAGKSTILRCVAGLLPIERGRIEIRGEVVDDPSRTLFVPAEPLLSIDARLDPPTSSSAGPGSVVMCRIISPDHWCHRIILLRYAAQ